MKRVWGAALCAVIIAGIAGVTTTAGAQSSNEKPKATDVGITDKEIHIAVIADVDNTDRRRTCSRARRTRSKAWRST